MAESIYYCTKLVSWPCLTWEQWATFWQAASALSATLVAIAAVFVAWHFPYRQRIKDRARTQMAGAFASMILAQRIRETLAKIDTTEPDPIKLYESFQKAKVEIKSFLPDAQHIGSFGTLSKSISLLSLSIHGARAANPNPRTQSDQEETSAQLATSIDALIKGLIGDCMTVINAGHKTIEKLEVED